jgi:predicted esterase
MTSYARALSLPTLLLGLLAPWPVSADVIPRAQPAPRQDDEFVRLRASALAALAEVSANPKIATDPVVRDITLPSIERLIQDADDREAHVTWPARDAAFVRSTLVTARAYAERAARADDPYATATGPMVKAYRADWDGTLQPYALYVPGAYDRHRAWPLVVALHGALSDHRHNLRRVFGLDNRPGESDYEASRNWDQPFPDVPALVVSPYARGELMGYDGLGGDDVMRVIADVRRAYNVDAVRISLTGLSMGGGGAWAIGLRHPEMFAALAPVCGLTDFGRMIQPSLAPLYDLAAMEALAPPALAGNAAQLEVLMFHGAADPTVPVGDSRRMVDRFRALGWLGKNVHYTEYAGVGHAAWALAYKDAALLRRLAASRRDAGAPSLPGAAPPPGQAIPGLCGKSVPRERPHVYVYGTHGSATAVEAARRLATAAADWGPMVAARFPVKADRDVTDADRARLSLVLVGAPPLNSLAAKLHVPGDGQPLGDRAFRAVVPDPKAPGGYALVWGALTPSGFARLGKLARHNSDAWAPEPNRPFAYVPP